jgi:hypothetical protein
MRINVAHAKRRLKRYAVACLPQLTNGPFREALDHDLAGGSGVSRLDRLRHVCQGAFTESGLGDPFAGSGLRCEILRLRENVPARHDGTLARTTPTTV